MTVWLRSGENRWERETGPNGYGLYNFPQGRVTDHRIGLTLYQLEDFLNGNMDEMVNALMEADQIRKIKEGEAVV